MRIFSRIRFCPFTSPLLMNPSRLTLIRYFILWMAISIAVGFGLRHLAPGNENDSRFWFSMVHCEDNVVKSILLSGSLWQWCLPSFVILFCPLDIYIPWLRLKLDKSWRCKSALWLFMAIFAFFSIPHLISMPRDILAIFDAYKTPVFSHPPGFCCVCDWTLRESLNGVMLPCIASCLWLIGLWPGLRNFLSVCRCCPDWLLKFAGFPRNFYPMTCTCLFLALLVDEIWMRFSWAQWCIHQGFH